MHVKIAIRAQNPDWSDLNVMLNKLLDSTEKEMVNKTAISAIKTQIAAKNLQRSVNDIFPLTDPS